MSELGELGVERARELVLAGAVAMLDRSLAAYRQRGDVGLGWLAEVVRTGGPFEGDVGVSSRERVVAERNWWMSA